MVCKEETMSLENLMGDLKNGIGMARVNAAAELGKLKDKRAEKALIEALKDKNMAVRNNAAFALGSLGHVRRRRSSWNCFRRPKSGCERALSKRWV